MSAAVSFGASDELTSSAARDFSNALSGQQYEFVLVTADDDWIPKLRNMPGIVLFTRASPPGRLEVIGAPNETKQSAAGSRLLCGR